MEGFLMANVLFDFDGVIHSYISGWKGPENIPDPPVPGVKEEIDKLRADKYNVYVFSTRSRFPEGREAIEKWLFNWGIEVDGITMEKIPAVAIVDDRAIGFVGIPDGLYRRIVEMVPWTAYVKTERDMEKKIESFRKRRDEY